MWSTTTVVGSAVKKSHSSGRSTRLEIDRRRASRAARCGAAISISSSVRREVDQALDEVEAHAAHAGVMHRCSSASVTLRRRWRRRAPCRRSHGSASTSARLSAPWQVACTITLRAKPRWSRSANSCSFDASQGVYLRSGANGNSAPGPNTWQCASTAPAGSRKRGLHGPAYQSSQPGVFSKVGIAASSCPSCRFERCARMRSASMRQSALRAKSGVPLAAEQRRRRRGRRPRPGARRCRRRRPRRQPGLAHGLGRPRAPPRRGGGRAR